MGAFIRKYPAVVMGVVCVLILAYVLVVPSPKMRLQKLEEKSFRNAQSVAKAARQYAREHDGAYPASLDLLFPNYLQDRSTLTSPLNSSEPIGYIYTPAPKGRMDSPDMIVLEDKFAPAQVHQRVVVFADSSAKALPVQ